MTRPTVPWRSRGLWSVIALPLVIQTLVIISMPLQAAIAHVWGQTVILRTVPVAPDAPFRGYYITLQYDISQRGILSRLDGWQTIKPALEPTPGTYLLEPGEPFFVVLAAPAAAGTTSSSPWQPVLVSRQRPQNLPPNQIALRGLYRRDRIVYGLERYYLPEAERLELEEQIRQAQTDEAQPRLMVEVRISPFGQAIPIALWLNGQRLPF